MAALVLGVLMYRPLGTQAAHVMAHTCSVEAVHNQSPYDFILYHNIDIMQVTEKTAG